MALRREIEEKKRREGKIKEPQYTQKQLEMIKAQKDKERLIRERLTELNRILKNCVASIKSAARGNPNALSLYYKDLIPCLLEACQSPLAAPYLTNLFIDLRSTVTISETLSKLVAHVTLRLLGPQCDLDSAWEDEPLQKAITRTVTMIFEMISKQNDSDSEEPSYFSAPGFCYVFPLLKMSLLSKYAREDETIIVNGLKIISEHSKLRGSALKNDPYHPKFLPRKQMLSLLVELINSTSGRIQSQAIACFLNVSASASSQTGCSNATPDEIAVLLSALQSPADVVRDSALRGLTVMKASLPKGETKKEKQFLMEITRRVLIAKYDVKEENRDLAHTLWSEANLSYPVDKAENLLSDVEHPVECIQQATSQALAALLEDQPTLVDKVLKKLLNLYKERLTLIPPKMDEFGRVIEEPIDTWSPRKGVAMALTQLAPLLNPDCLGNLVTFFVKQSLGDRNESVRQEMLNAALAVVDVHGKETISTLLPVFEQFMDKTPKSGQFDAVRQSVVILMGSLAKHLEKDDPRIKPIVMRLIAALSTPSQQVQESVANCLPHLIPSVKEEAPALVNKLLNQLLKSEKYGDRKGRCKKLFVWVKRAFV